jgi:hypothetical protein
MATDTRTSPLARFRPRRQTLLWGALLVNTEILLLLAYSIYGNSSLLTLRGLALWLYPFVWINAALWAIVRTDIPAVEGRTRWLAGALAVGYFGVLAYAGGLVGHSHMATGFSVTWTGIPPGWAPAVNYGGAVLNLTLIPYKVIGYLALTYLVYATILDATRSAVTGVLGLLSCVSCSWPVLASLAAGVFGGGSGIAAAATGTSYTISTVVFVATVALLYWRPFGSRA